jgi:cullin-associated NEDD8-dissociated protein 1
MAADKNTFQQNVTTLLSKFSDPDPDIRYMSLNDLYELLSVPSASHLSTDSFLSTKVTDGLLKALEDQNGEVQNQALKW